MPSSAGLSVTAKLEPDLSLQTYVGLVERVMFSAIVPRRKYGSSLERSVRYIGVKGEGGVYLASGSDGESGDAMGQEANVGK